ncbi:AAA family ATPase [Parerythrobacter aestuarii]|uniref:AAA family ATPase n=1 Tax=Parerythrobacter aestuarii TaxID=3020909 RepID=UPI0024DEA38E|nr:AAA family ATPase [Parerythrobacter aestuarii]
MRRAAITGGPGAGKSSLIAELARRDVATHDEVARNILQAPGGMALREQDPLGFAQAMYGAQLLLFEEAGQGTTVFDRGFADIAGFLDLSGLAVPPDIDRACRELRFEGPIFHAPAWRAIYTPDEERIQSWDEAVASDRAVVRSWRHYGYQLVELPLVSIDERAQFVIDQLASS